MTFNDFFNKIDVSIAKNLLLNNTCNNCLYKRNGKCEVDIKYNPPEAFRGEEKELPNELSCSKWKSIY